MLTSKKQELKGRAFVKETINEIIANVLAMEGLYNEGVHLFLSDLASTYAELVANFRSRGLWNEAIEYRPYNFVTFQDNVYMALSTSVIGTPPDDNEYWLKLGLQGEVGAPGVDVSVQFQWNGSKQYKAKDLVAYSNDLYVALKDNAGVEPGTDESTWLPFLIVARGKIIVGTVAPVNPVQNTIWLKTAVDPVATTGDAIGEMFRSRADGSWEPMYSSTLFTLVQGREGYAPLATIKELTIEPNQWRPLNGKYAVGYQDDKITSDSIVTVGCNLVQTLEEYRAYSDMELSVDVGALRFTLGYRPTMPLHVLVKIQ